MTDLELGKSKLQAALLDVSKNYLENLELAPEEEVFFSPESERKMMDLIKKPQKFHQRLLSTPFRKAIAACLAIIIFASTIMGCSQLREPIVAFLADVYEKFTEFFFGDDNKEISSSVIEEVRLPAYVPEEYTFATSSAISETSRSYTTKWENDRGDELILTQFVLSGKCLIDTENAEMQILPNDQSVMIIHKDNRTTAFWDDDMYAYVLMISDCSDEEFVKIINSVK